MIKTTILTTIILFSATMMMQEVSSEGIPLSIQHGGTGQAIPDWVKNNFEWYVNGQIDEKTLLTSMNWMFDNNIMHLSEKAALEVADLRAQVAEQQATIGALKTMGSAQTLATTPTVDDITTEGDSGGTTSGSAYEGISDAMLPSATSPQLNVAAVDVPTESGTQRVLVVGGENTDINALVQWVIRESYLETNKDLQFYAEKVRYYNDLKEGIRSELTEIRQYQSSLSEYAPTESEEIYPDEYGRVKLQFPWYSSEELKSLEDENESTMTEFLTLQKRYESAEADALDYANQIQENLDAKKSLRETISELRNIITDDRWPVKFSYYDENDVVTVVLSSVRDAMVLEQELEQKLQTMSDIGQMMQLDLQDAMQKQNQAMQTLSAIMKSQHDTLKAIISNMRA